MTRSPFHGAGELHQKDLRINLDFLQFLGPGNRGIPEADTFLALSLIVVNSMPRDPFTARRVDIPVIWPCEVSETCRYSLFWQI